MLSEYDMPKSNGEFVPKVYKIQKYIKLSKFHKLIACYVGYGIKVWEYGETQKDPKSAMV